MLRFVTALLVLAPAVPALAADGDCAAPSGPVADTICSDPGLVELDRELARVYELALADAGDTAPAIMAAQDNWRAGLQTCEDAATPIGQCVTARYATRLHELRADVPGLSDEQAGASLGPFSYDCAGFDGPVSAMFFNTGETGVSLRWDGMALVLPRTRSASGSRYAGDGADGSYVFWIQGREATMTLPDGTDRACREA